MDNDDVFGDASYWVNIMVFVIYMTLELMLLVKLRFKFIDKLSVLALITYTLCFAIRMLNWVISKLQDNVDLSTYQEIAFSLSSILIWVITYYYILEMLNVKLRLLSQNYTELQFRKRQTKSMKITLLILLIVVFTVVFIVNLLRLIRQKNKIPEETSTIIVYCIALVCKALLDISLLIIVIKLLYFFTQQKQKRLQEEGKTLTTFNMFIIGWVVFLIILNVLHSVGTCVSGMNITLADQSQELINFFEVQRNILLPITDFLNALTFLYLFYHQGSFYRQQVPKRKWVDNENDVSTNTEQVKNLLKDSSFVVKSQKTQNSKTTQISKGTTTTINEETNGWHYYVGDTGSNNGWRDKRSPNGDGEDDDDDDKTTFRSYLYYQIAVSQHQMQRKQQQQQ